MKKIAAMLTMVLGLAGVTASPVRAGDLSFGTPEVEVLQKNGDPGQKIDLVFVGDGYRARDLARFRSDVSGVVATLFAVSPFRERRNDFNVYRINSISREAGADHPSQNLWPNTAFDTTYESGGIDRGMDTANLGNLRKATNRAPACDFIVVLVNDSTWGGTSSIVAGFRNPIVTLCNDPKIGEITVHELGHSLGGLDDEYVADGDYTFLRGESGYPNSTSASSIPLLRKWADLVGYHNVGLFEGAGAIYSRGLYRPTERACLMRTTSPDFCAVCTRAMLRAIARESDRKSAPEPFIRAVATEGLTNIPIQFYSYVTDPDSTRFAFEWMIDGRIVSTDRQPLLRFERMGTPDVRLQITDDTGRRSLSLPIQMTIRTPGIDRGRETQGGNANGGRTGQARANRAPEPPVWRGAISRTARGNSGSYSLVASDPDGDALVYEFAWGDGMTSLYGYVASGQPVTLTHRWDKAGTFKVKVRVRDVGRNDFLYSPWSAAITVKIAK